jgi:hypothetical protein
MSRRSKTGTRRSRVRSKPGPNSAHVHVGGRPDLRVGFRRRDLRLTRPPPEGAPTRFARGVGASVAPEQDRHTAKPGAFEARPQPCQPKDGGRPHLRARPAAGVARRSSNPCPNPANSITGDNPTSPYDQQRLNPLQHRLNAEEHLLVPHLVLDGQVPLSSRCNREWRGPRVVGNPGEPRWVSRHPPPALVFRRGFGRGEALGGLPKTPPQREPGIPASAESTG